MTAGAVYTAVDGAATTPSFVDDVATTWSIDSAPAGEAAVSVGATGSLTCDCGGDELGAVSSVNGGSVPSTGRSFIRTC